MKLFPELEFLDWKDDRREVYRKALRTLRRRTQFWVLFIVAPILLALASFSVLFWLRSFFPISAALTGGLIGGVVGGTFGATFQIVFRAPLQRIIRTELVDRGIPVCIGCGYDLRGQELPRCPECGRSFDEKLLKTKSPTLEV